MIKESQVYRSFRGFIDGAAPNGTIEENDEAQPDDLHTWDDYLWVDVGRSLDDLDRVRAGKHQVASELVKLFDDWAQSETTFNENMLEEALGYGRSLMRMYWEAAVALKKGSIADYFKVPADS